MQIKTSGYEFHHTNLLLPINLLAELRGQKQCNIEEDFFSRESTRKQQVQERVEEVKISTVPKRVKTIRPRKPMTCEHQLYSLDQISEVRKNNDALGSRDPKDKKRVAELLDTLYARSGVRHLTRPSAHWRHELVAMADKFPNFTEVIAYLEGEFLLASQTKQALELAPILLDGPPGVGKTLFAQGLSDLFGSGFQRINMESAQTCSELTGSEEYWGNSRTGRLFNQLVLNDYANPVFLLDEVDKANQRGFSGLNATSGLYSLLEHSTAREWHDLSLPSVKLDVTKVIWVLTSNDKNEIPAPLLSRMRQFSIPAPDQDQATKMAIRMYAETVRAMPRVRLNQELPLAIAHRLTSIAPRVMKRFCRELVIRVIQARRVDVIMDDVDTVMKTLAPVQDKPSMGFV